MGEVDQYVQFAFQLDRPGELAAVVQGEAVAFLGRQRADRVLELLGNRFGRTDIELSRDQIAAGSVDAGQQVSLTAFAHESVAFPIPKSFSLVGLFGPIVNEG